jgi:hypothetical protein
MKLKCSKYLSPIINLVGDFFLFKEKSMSYWIEVNTDCCDSMFDQTIKIGVEDYFSLDLENRRVISEGVEIEFEHDLSWRAYAVTDDLDRITYRASAVMMVLVRSGDYFMDDLFPIVEEPKSYINGVDPVSIVELIK